MNGRAKKLMAGSLLALGLTAGIAGVAQAHDFGPPIDYPHVSCTAIWLDPPAGAWVHLVGDIEGHDKDGHAVAYHADEYGVRYGHNTFFPKTFALLDALVGKVEYELAATWSLGKGYSKASGGYLTCHPDDVTTTTTVKHETTTTVETPTTIPTPPTTVATPTTLKRTVPPVVKIGTPTTAVCTTEHCLLPPAIDRAARGVPVLPHTGSNDTWPLVGLGSALIAAGGLLVGKRRATR